MAAIATITPKIAVNLRDMKGVVGSDNMKNVNNQGYALIVASNATLLLVPVIRINKNSRMI